MDRQIEFLRQIDTDTNLPTSLQPVIIRRYSLCPRFENGVLDYNGMLDLECNRCGFSLVEAAGCS
jgi:hypothetical protein